MKRCSKHLTSVALAALMAVPAVTISSPGWAQLSEVVVSTRRRDENLQDIPVSVTALGSALIENEGIRNIADVMKFVPGVQFDQAFSGNDTRIAIRGINNSRGRASAAILVDGFDVSGETIHIGGGSSLLNTRLIDLERVEIVKGPQSALYGRNAFAGAVNYITKRPSLDGYEGNVSVDLNDQSAYEVRGRVSGPVVSDKLALSLNAATFDLDGYYDHPVTGSNLNGADSNGVGFGLLFEPNEDWSVYANVTYSEDSSTPRAAVANQANTDFSAEVGSVKPGVSYFDFLGAVDGSESEITQSGFSERTQGDFEGTDDETLRATVIAEWDLGFGTLKSTTGYLSNESSVHQDTDFLDGLTTVNPNMTSIRQDFVMNTDTEYFSQEITLASNGDGPWTWLGGASGFWEETESDSPSVSVWLSTNPGFDPLCTGFIVPCTFDDGLNVFGDPSKEVNRDTTSWSVFALLGYDVTDRINITGELRYIHDDIDVETNTQINRTDQLALGCPIDGTPGGFCGTDRSDTTAFPKTGNKTSNALNPRLSIDFAVNDDALIYASVAKGTKPGGFGTTQMDTPNVNNEMDQEKLWSYEIGAKTSWLDGTLQVNTALFYSVYEDRQIGLTLPCPGAPAFTCAGNGNAGEAESQGFELDVQWQPNDNLSLGLGYSYIDAEFTDLDYLAIRQASTGDPTVTAANLSSQQIALCGSNLDGNCDGAPIAGVPEHALTLSAAYQAPLSNSNFDWFVSANSQYTDERFLDSFTTFSTVDSYWNVDAQIGIESETLRVALYSTNLLDDDTPRSGQGVNDFRDGLSSGYAPQNNMAVAFLPPPRIIGVRANIKFGQ